MGEKVSNDRCNFIFCIILNEVIKIFKQLLHNCKDDLQLVDLLRLFLPFIGPTISTSIGSIRRWTHFWYNRGKRCRKKTMTLLFKYTNLLSISKRQILSGYLKPCYKREKKAIIRPQRLVFVLMHLLPLQDNHRPQPRSRRPRAAQTPGQPRR